MRKVVFLLLVLFTVSISFMQSTGVYKIAANDEPGPGRGGYITITTA